MTPPSALDAKSIDRFWSKVERLGPDECWPWRGWKNSSGHARFDALGEKFLASHLVLELCGQPRPYPGANALHIDRCDYDCCNPAHLFWGNARARSSRRDRLGRRSAPCGEAHPNAKIDNAAVQRIRTSRDSQRKLAAALGISQPQVGNIRRREQWKHRA